MYSEKLEKLITSALEDGILTSEEKGLIFEAANAEGFALGDFSKFLDAALFIRKKVLNATVSSYSAYLQKIIDIALSDGILTDGEKEMLLKEATAEGIDTVEFEQYLNAVLVIKQLTSTANDRLNNIGSKDISKDSPNLKIAVDDMVKILDEIYDAVLEGVPKLDSAIKIANVYIEKEKTLSSKVNALIRHENSKAGTYGLLSGLDIAETVGSFVLKLPEGFALNIYIRLRMIAAIAYIAGYDLNEIITRVLVISCATGDGVSSILTNIGINDEKTIKSLYDRVVVKEEVRRLKEIAGSKIIEKSTKKFATKYKTVGKVSPYLAVVIGIVSGTSDTIEANTIGNVARDVFIGSDSAKGKIDVIAGGIANVVGVAAVNVVKTATKATNTANKVAKTATNMTNDVSKKVNGTLAGILAKSQKI
ncbi:MAG: hypothetical protein LBO69_05965 [Ignavibacteria bacterium]|jgi:hypothetical protein|nr:hypothetical protein [Ignavibacteria bacterium]